MFQVQVQDEGANGSLLDCIMGVSADTVVFVEDSTRQIVLVLPTTSLLGEYLLFYPQNEQNCKSSRIVTV